MVMLTPRARQGWLSPALSSGGLPATPDWYVDSVSGNDSNAGTSSGAAFATIAKLQTVLSTGETVSLARGSHWREQLGSSPGTAGTGTNLPDNVSFVVHGTGNLPILDASDVIDMSTATLAGGTSNTWEISVTTTAAASADFWCTLFRTASGGSTRTDFVRMTRVANAAAVESTAGSFYIPKITSTGPHTLSFHPPGSVDPTADGATYEVTVRATAFSSQNATGVSVNGLHCRRAMWTNGAFVQSLDSGQISKNVVAEDGTKHTFFQGAGLIEDCWSIGTPDTASITGGDGLGFTGFTDSAGLSLIRRRCKAVNKDPSTAAVAFFSHASATTHTKVSHFDCVSVGFQTAYNVDDCDEDEVDGFAVWESDAQSGGVMQCRSDLGSLANVRVYGEKSDLTSATRAIDFIVATGGATWTISNSLFATSRENAKNAIYHAAGLLTLTADKVALVTHGAKTAGFPFCCYSNGTSGSSVKFTNSLLYTDATNAMGVRTDSNSDVASTQDNNHFSTDVFDMRRAGGTTHSTVTAWVSNESPRDANSVTGAVTLTDDSASEQETAGMLRFSGHTAGTGPDMTDWNEDLDPDAIVTEAYAA